MTPPAPPRPIDTARLIPSATGRKLYRLIQPLVERAAGFPAMWRLYDACREPGLEGPAFAARLLRHLQVDWHLDPADQAALQAVSGPLVVVANHPHGGIDAFVLMQVLEIIRPGAWRMLGNEALSGIPELSARLIPVDPLGRGATSVARNARALRASLRHLHEPSAVLGLFPAARVSHRERRLAGAICDRPWSDHAVRLAAQRGASLACLYISGANRPAFLRIPPRWSRLRALALCRELLHPPTEPVAIGLAALLAPAEVQRLAASTHSGERLRARCYLRADARVARPDPISSSVPGRQPVAKTPPGEVLAAEVAGLDPGHLLLRSPDDAIDVLLFPGHRAPRLLQALGVAREVTFRAAGQGSGLACDLAPEDEYYQHLVLWHRAERRLMGAYRLGFTPEILAARGPAGLYLDHVFHIDPRFYARLGPAVELSRSFVCPDDQRDNRTLALLWRGLGLAAQRAACPVLFGSVTISNDHHPATRALLVDYLRRARPADPALRRLVRARRPFVPVTRYHPLVGQAFAADGIEALGPLVDQIEAGARGIPPLLRYYCSLNARFIDFHVEAAWQDAIYCLLTVDLRTIPPAYRRRFLG